MKIAANRGDAFVARPDPDVVAVLIYGPDTGLVRQRSRALIKGRLGNEADSFGLVTLSPGNISKDPSRLSDEALSIPLMGGERVVRVRDAGDTITPAVRQLLDGPKSGLVILEAGELGPRSSLRQTCEKSAAAAALPCYMATQDSMARYVRAALAEAGLAVDPDAEAALADLLLGDRELAQRELEKLILYMGTAKTVRLDDVRACIGDNAEESLDALSLAVADGDFNAVERTLAKLFDEGTSAVAVLRVVQRHFLRLHAGATALAAGERIDGVITSLRLFFRVQPRVRAQLQRWSLPGLESALDRLSAAEADCKRTGFRLRRCVAVH